MTWCYIFIMYRYLWYAFFHPSATLHFSIVIFRSSWGKYILSAKKTLWIFCFPQYKCRLKISECRVPKASLDILDMETINKVDAQSHNWPSSNTLRGWGGCSAISRLPNHFTLLLTSKCQLQTNLSSIYMLNLSFSSFLSVLDTIL